MAEKDLLTPQQQRATEQRILHDAELINGGASIDHLGTLSVSTFQQDNLHREMENAQQILPNVSANAKAHLAANQEEATITPQYLSELLEETPYIVELRSTNSYTILAHRANAKTKVRPVSQGELRIAQALASLRQLPPEDARAEEAAFRNLDVAEVMTILPSEELFGERSKGFNIIQYKTLVLGQEKYKYAPLGDSRGGQFFVYSMLLSQDKASELWKTLRANPGLAHQIGDAMAQSQGLGDLYRNELESPSNDGLSANRWKNIRPPYDEWQEVNGGVSRIAFRIGFGQSPDNTEIIEFTI